MKSKIVAPIVLALLMGSCDKSTPTVSSGVKKASVSLTTDPSSGLTIEQENIKRRLQNDNKPGAIKHLYLVSPFTGDIILYSTVKGKVTSSGKRLTPTSMMSGVNQYGFVGGEIVSSNHDRIRTSEVLQDDGSYGTSTEYLYFWDINDVYRQVVPGACTVLISDEPLNIGQVKLRMGTEKK